MFETLVSSDCGSGNPNIHHNIPSSRGGTNEDINLSTVATSRHAEFHAWASNKTPCQLARQLALHSLGAGNKSVGRETVYALIRATTVREWSHHYRERAIHSLAGVTFDIHKVMTPQMHMRTQLLEELAWTQQTIHALNGKGHFPAESHLMLSRALAFFNTSSTRQAIGELLSEKNGNEYAWTKPMKHDEREYITNALLAPEGFMPASRILSMQKALSRHASTLDTFQESMRPGLEQYERFRAAFLDQKAAASA